MDLKPLVANPGDQELLRKAKLDCDWYAENTRCFASLAHDAIEFLPSWVCGKEGILEVAPAPREPGEERWLVMMGHQPQMLGTLAGKIFSLLSRMGVRHLYYAFDEASRCMPAFPEIAPHLSVLVHDEAPLNPAAQALLPPFCHTLHRSWVANLVPFMTEFNEAPENKILFLGSQLGLTAHRQQQIVSLRRAFRDRFVASHDHSVPVADRPALNRFKVALCPEGRKFTTPAMAESHTDRPFWSGALGLVPVSENSHSGRRLQSLHEAGLIVRYPHGNQKGLVEACEKALATSTEDRRRIYEHFNRHETVGSVVAEMIAKTG